MTRRLAYLLLAILCVGLLVFNPFCAYAAESYQYFRFSTEEATNYVDTHKADISKKMDESCKAKISLGQEAIQLRNKGKNEKQVFEKFNDAVQKAEQEKGVKLPISSYLEYSRQIKTVFRHPNMTEDEFNTQFYAECIVIGGY